MQPRLRRKTTSADRPDGPGCGEFDTGRGLVAHVLRALGAMTKGWLGVGQLVELGLGVLLSMGSLVHWFTGSLVG